MYPFNGGPTPTTSIDYIMDFFDEFEGIIEKFERFKNLCDEFEDFNDPNIEIAARKYVEVFNPNTKSIKLPMTIKGFWAFLEEMLID